MSDLREEKKLWKKGYKKVAGLDEAGRGPLSGPVVAAGVCFKKSPKAKTRKLMSGLKDSKKLSPKKREEFYNILTNHPAIEWGIGRVGPRVIDRINILEATKLAMKRAVRNLEGRLRKTGKKKHKIDFLILDGNFKVNLNIPQKSIVKADEKVFSCAAASIISKVSRDKMMQRYHKKYPRYGFDRHKGYPTKFHRKMLKKYGPSIIHRKSFKPVKNMLKYNQLAH